MTNRESGLYGRSRNVTTRRIIRLGLGFGQVVRGTHDDLNHTNPSQNSEDGLYVISVAARMLNMHPQTLRKYERAGLVQPSRTVGMLRLYSEEDIIKLTLIKHLVGDLGLNLAGVEMALGIFQQIMKMKKSLQTTHQEKEFLDECLNEMLSVLRVRIN